MTGDIDDVDLELVLTDKIKPSKMARTCVQDEE